MREIACFAHLESLTVSSPGVTNDSLRYLGKLTRLRALNVFSASLSDEGLSHLAALQGLEHLGVDEDHFSARALRELRDRLPKVHAGRIGVFL
jgi:hypothetical protein